MKLINVDVNKIVTFRMRNVIIANKQFDVLRLVKGEK